jgi:hypothetical protein
MKLRDAADTYLPGSLIAASGLAVCDGWRLGMKGRVPALLTDKGVLTENPVLLGYVAQTFPDAKLAENDDSFAFVSMQSFNRDGQSKFYTDVWGSRSATPPLISFANRDHSGRNFTVQKGLYSIAHCGCT